MFVTKNKYNEAILRAIKAEARLNVLAEDWNKLVRKINEEGGASIFNKEPVKVETQFTQEELAKLIRLCHPDKHDGSKVANEMTKKLLQLRK